MPAERPILTPDTVSQAETRRDVTHRIVAVLDQQAPRLAQLQEDYGQIANNQEEQCFISENYGFLADALVDAGSFSLQAEDLISIWSCAMDMFGTHGRYQRYALARMVSTAYAVQGVANPEWKTFPRSFAERAGLPDALITDREGLTHVQERLHDIGEAIDDINFYTYGTREDAMGLAFKLSGKDII